MQSKKHSWYESVLNTASGFVLSYVAGLIVFPLFGFPVTHSQNFWIIAAFTVISVVRNYFWRRAFNWWHHARH